MIKSPRPCRGANAHVAGSILRRKTLSLPIPVISLFFNGIASRVRITDEYIPAARRRSPSFRSPEPGNFAMPPCIVHRIADARNVVSHVSAPLTRGSMHLPKVRRAVNRDVSTSGFAPRALRHVSLKGGEARECTRTPNENKRGDR